MTAAKIIGVKIVDARILTDNKVAGRTKTNKELINQKHGIFKIAVRTAAQVKIKEGDKRDQASIMNELCTERQAGKFRRHTGIVYQLWAKENLAS